MSGEINVVSTSQTIVVQPAISTMSVINVGLSATILESIIAEALAGKMIPPGGKSGQVLQKQSDADNDFAWVDLPEGG